MIWARLRSFFQSLWSASIRWELPVKGVYYYQAATAEHLGLLSPGTPVTLKPEPDNEFDVHAVQIWLNPPSDKASHLLGYIPRTHSRRIHWLLTHAHTTTAEIASVYRQYQRLYIYVRLGFRFS